MGQGQLRSLVLLNVECDVIPKINEDEIIDDFVGTPLLRRLLVNYFSSAELGKKT